MPLPSCCPHPRQAWARPPKVDSGAGHVVRLRGPYAGRLTAWHAVGCYVAGHAFVLRGTAGRHRLIPLKATTPRGSVRSCATVAKSRTMDP